MAQCVAFGCKNRKKNKIDGITFHKFPKDLETRTVWENSLSRKNFKASKHSLICSLHFEERDFDKSSPFVTLIKKGAVPSVFPGFPKEGGRANEEQGEVTIALNTETKLKKLEMRVDTLEDNYSTAIKALHATSQQLATTENKLFKCKSKETSLIKTVRALKARNQRMGEKVSSLNIIIEKLKQKLEDEEQGISSISSNLLKREADKAKKPKFKKCAMKKSVLLQLH